MNKQQLLDLENPTPEQQLQQTLLANESKTSLEAIRRQVQAVYRRCQTTKMKQLPLENVLSSVVAAVELANGGETKDATPTTKK